MKKSLEILVLSFTAATILSVNCWWFYHMGQKSCEYKDHKITSAQYATCILIANEYKVLADEAHNVKTDREFDILMRHLEMYIQSEEIL